MARLNFNAGTVDPRPDFDPIPAGKYVAMIIDSEVKPTKAGTGNYLQLKFQILEGEFKDRLVWARFNLDNPNPKAVQIAQAELSALCRAINVMAFQETVELHHLPVVINVKCKKRQDSDEYQNEIKGYSRKETAASLPQQAVTSTPPWKRS